MTTLAAAVETVRARLATNPDVDVFVGDPVARMDSDGRAHPYLVVWPSPGRADPTQDAVCGTPGQRVWRFQVTAAGGDLTRALRAAQAALALLPGWSPAGFGVVREDADPGPVQRDTAATPNRYYTPLLFVVDID